MNLAPITLFTYNRCWHTKQTVEALAKNELASKSELFVYSDGPKTESDRKQVESTRTYLKSITGFKSVTILESEKNISCARSIISGVTEIVNRFGQIIVLEDDMVTAPHFLRYMNEALDYYRDEDRVICIHGYLYPVKSKLPETFLLKGADNWGWATWKRGWDLFEPDGQKLLNELTVRGMTRELDSYDYIRMLKEQIAGAIDAWDIQWYISALLNNKLTLFPGKSLVQNIGHDCSGTHCETTDLFSVELSKIPINISLIKIEENLLAKKTIGDFRKSTIPSFTLSLIRKIRVLAQLIFFYDRKISS